MIACPDQSGEPHMLVELYSKVFSFAELASSVVLV